MCCYLFVYGWVDCDVIKLGECNGKFVMVVLLEYFYLVYFIYCIYLILMIVVCECFYLIGVGGLVVDEVGCVVFDEFVLFEGNLIFDKLNMLKGICEDNGVFVFYMLSIGMDLMIIFVSNICLVLI